MPLFNDCIKLRRRSLPGLVVAASCLFLSGCLEGFTEVDSAVYKLDTQITNPVTLTTLTTSDGALALGAPATATNGSVAVIQTTSNSQQLWAVFADPWGVTTGTGQSSVAYSGSGAVTMSINYTGLNDAGVNGYPFIGYGGDPYGYHNGNQAPQFPAKLSSMDSLYIETAHSLNLTTAPGDLDVAYDEWLIPSASYSGGPGGSVEVMLMYYYNFGYVSPCLPVRTMMETVTYNGAPTVMSFFEIECGSGAGDYIAFIPQTNIAAGTLRVNLLDFLNEAATESGVGTDWYVAGINFGTEYGHASSVNYTMDLTKFNVEQTLK